MSRGKGLVQFIVHMSHLTPVGWGYFGCSILLSGAFYSSSKKVLPYLIKVQARKSYPEFEWIIIPQYSISLSLLSFIIMNSFLGYFCESNNVDDDIVYFIMVGIVFFLFVLFPKLLKIFRLKCFMKNNDSYFISRFSLLGFYRRINVDKSSVIITPDAKGEIADAFITFVYNERKMCKLDKKFYSEAGWNLLKRELAD